MVLGSWPQSWIISKVCSPLPVIGSFVPALSCACRMIGPTAAAAVVVRNVRRVIALSIRPLSGSGRIRLLCHGRKRGRVAGVDALGVAEATLALAAGVDVEHDV